MARSLSEIRERSRARAKARAEARAELKNTAYEIFIGALSILSIFNLVLVYAVRGDSALELVLSVMNALFSAIFLGDFIYRISTAPKASRYFFRGFGWADLLASLPFPQFKILRLFRLLRVFRLLRELGPRTVWTTLVHDRANSALMTLLLMGILVLQFGSISILYVEENADGANITTASDALWYTLVTISTVGYGDQYPVTNVGRMIGTLIIIVGVGIFGTFTGYLANLFLGPRKTAEDAETDAATPPPADDAAAAPAVEAEPTLADHAAKGVAAGAVAGAVKAGATAGSGPGTPVAGALESPGLEPEAREVEPEETVERLRALLAQSELALAEMRRLLADATR
ncbi:potassium channel family protein [Microbacterium ureisolvens]|uniref:Potassium channel family protein n=1 Tax=Microbacterium ureisolvens TaxID=2781186 RepID=A0ABS7HW35_9MICO|nr:potassium channel family protein [Microbacterium ureisolvens]MBW9109010.1 potassium channel family protein [Microbacterium ureisolvens]